MRTTSGLSATAITLTVQEHSRFSSSTDWSRGRGPFTPTGAAAGTEKGTSRRLFFALYV